MIELISGCGVGAGKSYYVTNRVIQTIRNGGTVYYVDTYQPIFGECSLLNSKREYKSGMYKLIRDRYGVEIERDQLVKISEEDVWRLHEVTPPGTEDNPVLIVCDEGQGELNAKDWNDKRKRDFFAWCCQSRHDNNDLIFLSQSEANLDKQLRRLCTFTVRVKNLANWGIGQWKNPPYFRNFFWGFVFDRDTSNVLWIDKLRKDSGIYGCYVSKSMAGEHKRLKFRGGVPRRNLVKVKSRSPVMKVVIILLLVLVGIAGSSIGWQYYSHTGMFARTTIFNMERDTKAGSVPVAAARNEGGMAMVGKRNNTVQFIRQIFRGTDGCSYLVTDVDEFFVGEMCEFGLVKRIADHTVEIIDGEGRPLYVTAVSESKSNGVGRGASQLSSASEHPWKHENTVDSIAGAVPLDTSAVGGTFASPPPFVADVPPEKVSASISNFSSAKTQMRSSVTLR